MAITIDWPTKIINIPRADLVLLQSTPTFIYQLNMQWFHEQLRDIEDNYDGMANVDTHKYVGTISVGGVVLSPVVEIINGYTVTFEDGQYRVNLSGANTNLADVTNVNQVSVASSNSAGLQDLSTILIAAYNGEVCVDKTIGQSGQVVPLGTRGTPSDNFPDAKAIADKNSIKRIRLLESMTIDNINFDGYTFTQDSIGSELITIDPSASVVDSDFFRMNIQGTMDGGNVYRDCVINDITFVSGFMMQCGLAGTITMSGGNLLTIFDSYSDELAAANAPVIDFGGAGELILRNYSGSIKLTNHTSANVDGDVSIDLTSGVVEVDSTCTAGTIIVRGVGEVIDNSTGTCNVVDETLGSSDLSSINASLTIINDGVQNASLLIPHTTDLP